MQSCWLKPVSFVQAVSVRTSRVDKLRQAIEKARSFDFDLQGL